MTEVTLSPDRRTRVEWAISTGRMSHEICSPRIRDAKSGEIILDLWKDGSWDAAINWTGDGIMHLCLRHYIEGGTTSLDVAIDRAGGTFRIDNGPPQPMAAIQREVPAAFWRKAKTKS
jgi:hypothetical protein